MVSKYGSVSSSTTGSLNDIETDSATQERAGSLGRELALLFGEQVFKESKTCRLSSLDFTPSDIVAAARWLRRLDGQPAKQREVVESLPTDVQLALCRWIWDFKTPERVLAVHGVRAN